MKLWEPFINFFSDVVLIQFTLILLSTMFMSTINSYKILLNLFLFIFIIGIYISISQLDVIVGFLWVLEITIIFCSTIILIYLNSDLNSKFIQNYNVYIKYLSFFILFFIVCFNLNSINLNISINFICLDIWEDFYNSISIEYSNDLTSLFYSFYFLNSFSFILIGFCLFFCSLILINLNKVQKTNKNVNDIQITNIFNIIKNFVEIMYLRKQDLIKQSSKSINIKIFKKNDTKRNATCTSR